VARGNIEVVTALVAAGAALNARNSDGRTPLDLAAERGRTEAVAALLDADAGLTAASE